MISNGQSTHNDQSDVILKIGESLYLNEEMADFHFIFETSKDQYERIPAHKLLLMTASDVFRTMFNGSWEEMDEVEIIDATVDEFKEFLQFFYLRQVNVSMENVPKVMYLGDKYNITKCLNVCEKFIINTLDEDNIIWAYELAIFYNQAHLKKYCETLIEINTKAVLTSGNFLECHHKVLGNILKLDSLSCPENEVFDACMNWVKATTKVDQLTREVVQAHLGGLFYEIRIKSMTPQDFDNLLPEYGQLFSVNELKEISQAFAPQDFPSNMFNNKIRKLHGNSHCDEENVLCCDRYLLNFRSALWFYYIKGVETTRFSTNRPMFLAKFLCSRIYGCLDDAYYEIEELPTEIIIVQLPRPKYSEKEIILYSEINTLQSDKCTYVTLPKPLLIRPGIIYEIRLKQSPPHRCCSGVMLKTEVEIESNIIVQFHGETPVEIDKVTSGMIASLQFNRIY